MSLFKIFTLFSLVFLCFFQVVNADQTKFKTQDHYLLIGTTVPPAAIYVIDQQGNITGADLSQPIGEFGYGSSLHQIPNSYVERQNIANDESGNDEPQSTTSWGTNILDQPTGNYTVVLKGLGTGISPVMVFAGFEAAGVKVPEQDINVFASSGVTHQLQVAFDPIAKTLSVQRIVKPDDLGTDVNAACQLNLISPNGICQSLQAKADSITKDAQKGNAKSEIQHVQVFLKELQVADKNHIQEPAFTILQDEAQILLNTLNSQQPQASTQPSAAQSNWLKGFWNRLTKIL